MLKKYLLLAMLGNIAYIYTETLTQTPTEPKVKTSSGKGYIKEINSLKEYEQMFTENKPVMIEFSATWCSACKMMEPALREFAKKHPDISLYTIDVDTKELQPVVETYVKRGIPTLVLFDRNHNHVNTRVGSCSVHEIEKMLVSLDGKTKKENASKKKDGGGFASITSLAEYQNFIKTHSHAAIDLSATWCGACTMFKPIIEETAKEYPSIAFAGIDIEEIDTPLANFLKPYRGSLPTVLYIKDGTIIHSTVGAYPAQAFKDVIENTLVHKKTNGETKQAKEEAPQPKKKSPKKSRRSRRRR